LFLQGIWDACNVFLGNGRFIKRIIVASLVLFFGLVTSISADTVTLSWTAVGNDRREGTASEYDVRYHTSPISEANFYDATRFVVNRKPLPAGATETLIVDGLVQGVRYFFAIKTADSWNNWSTISNVVSKVACVEGCVGIRGNIDGDLIQEINIKDIVYMVDYYFGNPSGPEPHCLVEADIDGSLSLDIYDLIYLVNYMFVNGSPPVFCP